MRLHKVALMAALAVFMSVFAGADQADAGWGWHSRSAGSYGSGGSWGRGSWGSYGSYGGSWGSRGSYGGSWGGRYYRRAHWGSYGSYGCWGSGYTSYRYSYGSYGSYGGSWGSRGGSVGRYYVTRVATPVYSNSCGSTVIQGEVYDSGTTYEEVESVPAEMEDEAAQLNSTSALLAVDVPVGTTIYVNGHRTTSKGAHREYLSENLDSGRRYSYKVRAVGPGQEWEETKVVSLSPGSRSQLRFEEPVQTVLTVHVPEDAKVVLAGSQTAQQGVTRVFASSRLAKGASWENYQVAVTFDRDGEEVTESRTLTLVGGEAYEVDFRTEETLLASN